jgi:ribose/xylose/arabinose/galactoside ABC-type transport system permease subunit
MGTKPPHTPHLDSLPHAPSRASLGGREIWGKLKWPLVALGLVLLFNLIFTPGFFRLEIKNGRLYGSLIDILNRAAPVMLLSIGMTLVIATGGVDLSVGALMAIAGAIAALSITRLHFSIWAVIAMSLAAALLAGLWNGLLVAFLEVQPIVATLILMVAGRGIAQLLTDGQIITFENKPFEFLAGGSLCALPFTITIVVLVFALAALLTRKTALGLFIEAVGDNETASRYSGINTRSVKLLVYAFCGFCAGVAGLIVASDIKAADTNNAGLYLELDAILAVVIGGTALTGGRFYLLSSLIGALLIQALTTTILTRGIPVEFTLVVKALVIVAVCLLQSETFRQSLLGGWKSLGRRLRGGSGVI